MKYIARQGERWDEIAWRMLGSSELAPDLINANRSLVEKQVFKGGEEIELPSASKVLREIAAPWKR